MRLRISTRRFRILLAIIVAAAGTIFLKSCELDDFMMCRKVTYVDGEVESATEWQTYSGTRLEEILDEEDVTIGNRTTRWECR